MAKDTAAEIAALEAQIAALRAGQKGRSRLEHWLGKDLPRRPNGRGSVRLQDRDGYLVLRTRYQHHGRSLDGPSRGVPRATTEREQREAVRAAYQEVGAELDAWIDRLHQNETPNLARERRTVGAEWLDWLEAVRARAGAAHATYKAYRTYYEQHVRDYPIARVPLRDVRRADLAAWLAALARDGKTNATRGTAFDRMRQVFTRALGGEDAAPLKNLAVLVHKDTARELRPAHQAAETVAFSDAETETLLDACQRVPLFGTVFAVCLYAKARIGEACGLRWRDVRLFEDAIAIVQQIPHSGTEPVPVKGKRAHTVPVDHALVEWLIAHRKWAEAQGQACGPDDLVFQHVHQRGPHRGKRAAVTYSVASKAFLDICVTAGFEATYATHRLRHSSAMASVREGTNIDTLRRQLRHADVRTTLRYVHADDALARQDAERAGKRLRGRKTGV